MYLESKPQEDIYSVSTPKFAIICVIGRHIDSQFFSGKPKGPFCLSCTFVFRNERNWMKKSVRVSK